jgi:hypothetical protein
MKLYQSSYFLAGIFFGWFLFLPASCKEGKKKPIPQIGQTTIYAIHVGRDSSRVLRAMVRDIVKLVKTDTFNAKDMIVVDTFWYVPVTVPLMDSTGKKALFDSLGNPRVDPKLRYVPVNKDSVITRIENISVDSLTRKK